MRHLRQLTAAALLAASFWSAQAPAQAPAAPLAFDIPSQPMAAALNAWAVQANAQVFVDPGPVAHLTAPAVKGTLTPRQALRALLARTNLQVTQGTDGVFVIKPRPAIATVIRPAPEAPQATAAPLAPPPPEPLAGPSAGSWLVGLGAQFEHDHAGATSGAAASLSGEFFITDQLAAALSATTPRTLSFAAPATPYRLIARLQSTAVALKYYFAPQARLDPFLGAGVDIATLYDAGSVTGLDRVRAAATVEAGLDVRLEAHWMITAGVSWAQVRPDIDPVQFGLGFVYRFGPSGD